MNWKQRIARKLLRSLFAQVIESIAPKPIAMEKI